MFARFLIVFSLWLMSLFVRARRLWILTIHIFFRCCHFVCNFVEFYGTRPELNIERNYSWESTSSCSEDLKFKYTREIFEKVFGRKFRNSRVSSWKMTDGMCDIIISNNVEDIKMGGKKVAVVDMSEKSWRAREVLPRVVVYTKWKNLFRLSSCSSELGPVRNRADSSESHITSAHSGWIRENY